MPFWPRFLPVVAVLSILAACAGPSQAQRAEQDRVGRMLMRAQAVHMPPPDIPSCMGVTVRLSDPSGQAEMERAALEGRITEAEEAAALAEAGIERCRAAFSLGLAEAGLPEEPLALRVAYGVDPEGRVCAVVERGRGEPIDPAAGPMIEGAARCLKDTMFAAGFPAGRVEDQERVVRYYTLSVKPAGTSTAAGGAAP